MIKSQTSSDQGRNSRKSKKFNEGIQDSIFKDMIVINVLDPTNIKKDEQLSFSRSLLQKHMKYFEKSMEQKQLITIEHDSAIFEWLLRYILQIED